MNSFPAHYCILSIDGGGIRGIIPAMVLAEIEKRTNKPIYELFNLIAGTSTGGLLASGLTIRADNEVGAKYSAADLVKLYDECGGEIFSKSGWRSWLGSFDEFFGSRFDAKSLEMLLLRYFGDARLKDTLTEIIVTSYCIQRRIPIYFNSRLAKMQTVNDFFIRDICRATSAGPTYFEPKEIPSDTDVPYVFIDGGVYANHPGIIAYTEAKKWFVENDVEVESAPLKKAAKMKTMMAEAVQKADIEEPFFMLSLGTGNFVPPYPYQEAKEWGIIKWVKPITNIMMQGVSENTNEQLMYLLPPTLNGTDRYVRINKRIDGNHSEISDASRANIDSLKEYGRQIIQENDKALDVVCGILTS